MRHSRLRQVIGYSLTRPEAYLIVGLVFAAVLVAIVGQWPAWIIAASIGAGLVLMVLLIIDSLSDPNAEREAAMAGIDLDRLSDRALRGRVQRAIAYVDAARKLAARDAGGAFDPAGEEIPELEDAVRSVYQMALRLQECRLDPLVQKDLEDLRARSGNLTADQKAQLSALRRLEELGSEAEQEIESALANLGRSYAELQAISVTPEFKGRAADALGQLRACTRRLGDLAKGYDEAFSGRSSSTRT